MEIKVDIGSVLALVRRSESGLRSVDEVLEREVRRGARAASRRHPYKNRTGRLSEETKAVVESFSDADASVVLTADTEYAEYVRRRGLMSIDKAASDTEDALEKAFGLVAEKIADG